MGTRMRKLRGSNENSLVRTSTKREKTRQGAVHLPRGKASSTVQELKRQQMGDQGEGEMWATSLCLDKVVSLKKKTENGEE